MKKLLLLIPLVAFLAACGEKYDVAYYKAHPDERKAKLAECKEHANTLGQSDNCRNAQQAQVSAFGSGGKPVYVTGNAPTAAKQ